MAVRDLMQRAVITALTTVERVQTGVSYNPLDSALRRNPYPQYRRLRERDPFHRSRLISGYVLSRYEDVRTILQDPRMCSDGRKQPGYHKQRQQLERAGIIEPGEDDNGGSMLNLDPPDHTRLRSLVSRAFTPRVVESLRPRIEQIVEEHLDAAEARGRMEIIGDLAYPLPVIVIAEMLGIPTEDREQFKHWSDEAVSGLGPLDMEGARRSFNATRALRAYLEPIAEERRREPREDLLSALVAAEDGGERLSMNEVFSTAILLLVAGNETTTNLIGNGMLALLRHPDQLEALRDDPSRIDVAVEELLRYDSPVQATGRFPSEDVEIRGHRIAAGQQLIVLLGAANRDPEQFDEPDRLDIGRKEVRHLSFSHGIHYCLGAPLARIEGQIAITALARRFPDMRLADERLDWGDNMILRGLKALPVTV